MKDTPSLHADMVVLAIGVTPDTALAKEAGLELGIGFIDTCSGCCHIKHFDNGASLTA